MSTLKKGDLVMTDMGLAWYDRIENGEHLVNPITWEKDHLSPHFSATKATRSDVEAYLKEKGWYLNQYEVTKDGYKIWFDGYGDVKIIQPILQLDQFDTAPEQLREAITIARLLNATK